MSHITPLWSNTTNIRNICILAHVDHGKTTLTDYLLASNSIISARQAGAARYMDSRADEQERGITMKSSAVALKYVDTQQNKSNHSTDANTTSKQNSEHIIHVIDSPGHIDFSSEVSHAVRLCDGAVVLVDVLEGVQVQTIAVLEQCWNEKLIPVLCLTKLDRLLTEVKMSTTDAYIHIRKLLESINAITSTFITRDAMKQHVATLLAKQQNQTNTNTDTTTDVDDSELQYVDYEETNRFEFLPEKGNVLFASAVDGWAFNIPMFAKLFSEKLGFSVNALQRALYGDYYYNSKDKKVSTKTNKSNKVMFVQMILDNIWAIYDTINTNDNDKINSIVEKLHITVPKRDLQSNDKKLKLQAILSRWLPLSQCVLQTVLQHIPNPITAQQSRMSDMWPYITTHSDSSIVQDTLQCNNNSQHVVMYISKMIDLGKKSAGTKTVTADTIVRHAYVKGKIGTDTTDESTATDNNHQVNPVIDDTEDDNSNLIAFARIYCGTLKTNSDQTLHIIGPKFNANNSMEKERALGHISTVPVKQLQLYMLMATDTYSVSSIPAGNVCGIGGLSRYVLKNATVSTDLVSPFMSMKYQTQPIVRVAVEPVNATDIQKLNKGLKLLNLADSNVSIGIQETGESVIIAAGELHLERCIRDLQDRYAVDVQLRVSAPIVPFRETVVLSENTDTADKPTYKKPPHTKYSNKDIDADIYNANGHTDEQADSNTRTATTPNRACTITLQALPLPGTVVELLEQSQQLVKRLSELQQQISKKQQQHTAHITTNDDTTTDKDTDTTDITTDAEHNIMLQQIQRDTAVLQIHSDNVNDTDDTVSLMSESTAVSNAAPVTQTERKQVETELQQFLDKLRAELKTATYPLPNDIVDKIWCFGPKKSCTNILANNVTDLYHITSIVNHITHTQHNTNNTNERAVLFQSIQNGLLNGFQLATQSGPLCDEPLSGVLYIIQSIELQLYDTTNTAYGSMSGQVLSTMKDLGRTVLPLHQQRLIEPIYQVDLQCTADQLGALYNVLTKRRGRIIKDELLEGTSLFLVQAYLPVTESFGFANDIRTKTGGQANPQLIFNHWAVIEIDPYWIPSTEQELEEHGVVGLTEAERANTNLARRLVDSVRRRKGLPTKTKIVESGSKQRTLNRKK